MNIQSPHDLFIAVQVIMGLSLFTFCVGYLFRKKNSRVHGLLGLTGVLLNLFGAIVLVYFVYAEGYQLQNRLPAIFGYMHRILAVIVTGLMFYMAYTGITKQKAKHVRVHKWFLLGYFIVYFSGMIVFQG